ncbi:hypothetical protein SDRG_08469 [Saprolegnia diclina VS20]|uniref:Uncharacterized protein n=1 Tax=Saprolegnia diclina (strain VS20) TaxID=1156394 RepID=T0Q7C8_SAPDV|nr:hypothetical protein SDRG_08469 [Saprolegnia diclina VS20]EQC33784.1 hypothetical protein SDRG_08469 [Saprolegnia diclina VS20]|eukprot:XP_008612579.1 hypothetical protein SDRG_08469 [Saprolegnia diclina VS20]
MTANREHSPLLAAPSQAPTAPSLAPATGPTRQVSLGAKQRPVQEVHPLPWFRSPELSMNKEKARLHLKRKQQALKAPERWSCGRYFGSLGSGEKCVHLLVLVILIFTIVVILSILFAPDASTVPPPRALRWDE